MVLGGVGASVVTVLGVELGLAAVLLVVVAAAAGGAAQSALGFGAAFTTVPAVALAAPELLPGSVLVAALPLAAVMLVRTRRDLDLAAAGRLNLGRLPGMLAGVAVVAVLPVRGLSLLVGLLLLVAVAASVRGWEIEVTPAREVSAGFVSGLTGAATGLGGPPLALLYRTRGGAVLRPTLAAVWVVGLPISIALLALVQRFTTAHLRVGLVLGAAMLAGLVAAAPAVRRLPDAAVRRGVLWWAALGAVLVLVRAALG